MWIITRIGFFSIVQKPHDKKNNTLTIRARRYDDLIALRDAVWPAHELKHEWDIGYGYGCGSDYAHRMSVPAADFGQRLGEWMQKDICYSNFKEEVSHTQGRAREVIYHRVWAQLLSLENDQFEWQLPPDMEYPQSRVAYGGVLWRSEDQKLLLRRPSDHFDGYAWTFAKGRKEPGEHPEAAALREVREETGYDARIVGRLPGVFETSKSATVFYLMEPVGTPASFDKETQDIRWVSLSDAFDLICQSANQEGQTRDSMVLTALEAALQGASAQPIPTNF
jgi:8-oxo-dGTP pyrophosphatase MutT (NUDIX family)